jgi:hypothetical protein
MKITLNKDGRKRKEHTKAAQKRKEEHEAKTGHLKGSGWDCPNDPRIDY